MRCVEELSLLPVWVEPDHLAVSALYLMKGHQIRAMAVLSQGRLAGFVTRDRLEGAAEGARVEQVMIAGGEVVPGRTSVRKAADLFMARDMDFAAVFSEDRFLGVLSPNLLLGELRRSWDPLTGLSWSDQLREWGSDNLKAGREVTILFFDLDDFRQYNKAHGHVVGDRVLRSVAEVFRSMIDPVTDVLVRYGGDEFAIGTLRGRDAAQNLAGRLCDRVGEMFVEGLEGQVSVSVGVSGGKRTKERENVHYAATLDNLINLASQDCQAKKESARGAPVREAVRNGRERPQVVAVSADDAQPDLPVSVYIQSGGAVLSGVELRQGRSLIETVARATATALEKLRPQRRLVIDEVVLSDNPRAVTVRARIIEDTGADRTAIGTATLGDVDPYRATAEATIDAAC